MIYEDDESRILKIRPDKGDPPDAAKDQAPETPEEKKILDDEEKKAIPNVKVNDDEDNDGG